MNLTFVGLCCFWFLLRLHWFHWRLHEAISNHSVTSFLSTGEGLRILPCSHCAKTNLPNANPSSQDVFEYCNGSHHAKTNMLIVDCSVLADRSCQDIYLLTHIPHISCNFLLVTHQMALSHWHKYCSTFLSLPAILQVSHQAICVLKECLDGFNNQQGP